MERIYRFDDKNAPNIDLLDPRLKWWNEDEYCIEGDNHDGM